MGIKRIVDTSFWTDGKVDEFTPEDKYFMLYLLTNPFTTLLGIYEISIKQVAFHLGYSTDAVKALLERFETKYDMIVYSEATNEIAIKNFLRHSIMKGGKPVEDCLRREIMKVKSKSLIPMVFRHVTEKGGLNETVKKIVDEYAEAFDDNDNNNDYGDGYGNGNGYGVSSPVQGTNRERIADESFKPTKPSKPVKHKHGEYTNVLLTDDELDKLKLEYPDWKERIERLSSYVASTGKSYKSHYATIRNWARKDGVKQHGTDHVSTTAIAESIGTWL